MRMNTLSFVVGCLMLGSCTVAQPAWDGATGMVSDVNTGFKSVVSTGWDFAVIATSEGVTATENAVGSVWGTGENLLSGTANMVEGAVANSYDFVTSPFSSHEDE